MLTSLFGSLRLPVLVSPLFIVSCPELVIACCKAGVAIAFPSLNARTTQELEQWIIQIQTALKEHEKTTGTACAPFGVNIILVNPRVRDDVAILAKYRIPFIITSLGNPTPLVEVAHQWGAKVLHDVISIKHAQKAILAKVDGLIAVCAGAGGHGGTLNPIPFTNELRNIWDGPLVLSGSISTGKDILSAQILGADMAYMGTRFIATQESNAPENYRRMIVEAKAGDICYTDYFTGIPGNYLSASITQSGMDPNALPDREDRTTPGDLLQHENAVDKHAVKAWRDVWGAGQGVGSIQNILSAAVLVEQLEAEYRAARAELTAQLSAL